MHEIEGVSGKGRGRKEEGREGDGKYLWKFSI